MMPLRIIQTTMDPSLPVVNNYIFRNKSKIQGFDIPNFSSMYV